MSPTPSNPPVPQTHPTTDVEKVVIKLSKDIEYLKEKVTELSADKLAEHFNVTAQEARTQFVVPAPTAVGLGRGSRPLLESEIKEALKHVDCAAAVARYLGVSYKTYRRYAIRYGLFRENRKGRGAKRKEYGVNVGKYPLDKVLLGEIIHPKPWKLKQLLFRDNKKQKICERCGWKESRSDGTPPLVINFLDGDSKNQSLDNIKIYCHNCTFCLRGFIRRGVVVFTEVPSSTIYL